MVIEALPSLERVEGTPNHKGVPRAKATLTPSLPPIQPTLPARPSEQSLNLNPGLSIHEKPWQAPNMRLDAWSVQWGFGGMGVDLGQFLPMAPFPQIGPVCK